MKEDFIWEIEEILKDHDCCILDSYICIRTGEHWFSSIKSLNRFFKIETTPLKQGLSEIEWIIDLQSRPNMLIPPDVLQERKTFHDILERKYEFLQKYKTGRNRRNAEEISVETKNRSLYGRVVKSMHRLVDVSSDSLFIDSEYYADLLLEINKIDSALDVKKKYLRCQKGKNYVPTNADNQIVALALSESISGKKVLVITPDKDILKLIAYTTFVLEKAGAECDIPIQKAFNNLNLVIANSVSPLKIYNHTELGYSLEVDKINKLKFAYPSVKNLIQGISETTYIRQ